LKAIEIRVAHFLVQSQNRFFIEVDQQRAKAKGKYTDGDENGKVQLWP
jgi:hypothetical protein